MKKSPQGLICKTMQRNGAPLQAESDAPRPAEEKEAARVAARWRSTGRSWAASSARATLAMAATSRDEDEVIASSACK